MAVYRSHWATSSVPVVWTRADERTLHDDLQRLAIPRPAPVREWRDWVGPYTTYAILGVLIFVVGVLPIWV